MNTYLITAHARLYSIHRLVQADSKEAAAAQIDQYGIRLIWIQDVTGQTEE